MLGRLPLLAALLAGCSTDFAISEPPKTIDEPVEPVDSDPPEPETPPAPADLTIDPPSVDFGKVDEGEAAEQVFTVTNEGGSDAVITGAAIALTEGTDGAFSVPASGFTLAPGASAEVTVTFHALPDPARADLVLAVDDGGELRAGLKGFGRVRGVGTQDLDFGYVLVGEESRLQLPLTNDGNSPVTITDVTSTDAHFPLAFTGPITVRPGESALVDVSFLPDATTPFDGRIRVESDATHRVPQVTTTGHGAAIPVAVCWSDPPNVAAIHDNVRLFGWQSYSPMGRPLTADWQWLRKPRGATARPFTRQLDQGPFSLDVIGEYVARLVVTDDLGFRSLPCDATIEAESDSDLWVEMFWEYNEDIDLHLVRGNGSLFTGSDCHYANCRNGLSWGAAGTDDDPYLDLDDLVGDGPENINITRPASNTYKVVIHDHPNTQYQGANPVTVNIYVRGQLAHTEVNSVRGEDDTVEVAEIDWTVWPPVVRDL